MIRLLVADDHALMRAGLTRIFALAQGFVVAAEAHDGGTVLEQLRHVSFDVLLMDMNMPGICGVDLIERVKAHQPHLPILVLTMCAEPLMAARALKAGASGYITKNCEPEVLLAAIRKVAKHENYITHELAAEMVFQVTTKRQPMPHHQLTSRELEVFNQLIAGHSAPDIAQRLSISQKTVSTHKTHLMEKLNAHSPVDLVRYAMKNGLLD